MNRPYAAFLAVVLLSVTFDAAARLTLEACTLKGSHGLANIDAHCGWFEQPEDPSDPSSATIALRVAVVRSLNRTPQPDAFTIINGGPGGSSLDLYADVAPAFAAIRRERDILIVDQRGTGASNPLDCPQLESMSFEYSASAIRTATSACLDQLPGNPLFYTTSIAVRDLEALRQSLGYNQLNLYGVSYGTRVAQHYARRFPNAVRTLIIDGVTPPEVPLGPNAAINAQRTLDRLFIRCAEDDSCARHFPNVEAHLADLAERLERRPEPLEIAHPVSGARKLIELNTTHLLLTLRMLSYGPETASLLPLIIDEASIRENFTPLAANALRIETELLGAIRFGMHNSVVCAEDIPFLGEVDTDALAETYIGADQVRSLQTICEIWPKGLVDDDLRQPLTTDVPTLILSGEEDPITPPDYGEMAHRNLPNSLHLVGRGQGHGLLTRGCIPRLINAFVERGNLKNLETDCVAKLDHQPFFLNLMGPDP